MNAATIIEDPEAYVAQRKKFMRALYVLWGTVIGEHQPSEENFYQWLDSFGVQTVADAIKRTSHKARQRARGGYPDAPERLGEILHRHGAQHASVQSGEGHPCITVRRAD
jgi:hypothetical protein